jgi:hypothetical protein
MLVLHLRLHIMLCIRLIPILLPYAFSKQLPQIVQPIAVRGKAVEAYCLVSGGK